MVFSLTSTCLAKSAYVYSRDCRPIQCTRRSVISRPVSTSGTDAVKVWLHGRHFIRGTSRWMTTALPCDGMSRITRVRRAWTTVSCVRPQCGQIRDTSLGDAFTWYSESVSLKSTTSRPAKLRILTGTIVRAIRKKLRSCDHLPDSAMPSGRQSEHLCQACSGIRASWLH